MVRSSGHARDTMQPRRFINAGGAAGRGCAVCDGTTVMWGGWEGGKMKKGFQGN